MSQTDQSFTRQSLPVLPRRGFGETNRKDAWWAFPALTFVVFGGFVLYATWAAFQGKDYRFEGGGAHYLSPFYSPELWGNAKHAWFGAVPGWWPRILPFSPALLILWAPGGFRLTCYYYRGAYYKPFWADPVACAVGEPRKSYWGESRLPLILHNLHRYFFYLAFLFLFLLAYDVWKAMWFVGADGKSHFGIGVGTIVLAVNVYLLSSYALGCHSFRHLVGGWRDTLSKSKTKKVYDCVSCLNRSHMFWAWTSLFAVAFADVYVRLCCKGIITDHVWRIF